MKKIKFIIALSILIAAAGGIAAFSIPWHGGDLKGVRYHIFLSYPWMFTVLYLGTAAIFLLGLKHFRTKPKVAYGFICTGLVLMVLAQSQLGLITYLNAWLSKWVHSGMIMLPYIFGGLFVFIGIRLFSRLLKIKNLYNSFLFVVPVTLVAITVALFLPHVHAFSGEFFFDLALGFMVWNAVFSSFATIVTLQVKKAITPVFSKAMAWLFVAMVVHTFGAWQIVAFQLIGFQHWYNELGYVILPFIVSGLIFLKAGYEFNKASEY